MATIQEQNLQASFEKVYLKQKGKRLDKNPKKGYLSEDTLIDTLGFSRRSADERSPT